jgi:selenocysteine lyase/cysteine desulfurase
VIITAATNLTADSAHVRAPRGDADGSWSSARPGVYLNNAASAHPRAPGVAEAVRDALLRPVDVPGRSGAAGVDVQADCRDRLASLLGCGEPARIVLTTNATHALNIAIFGLGLKPGDLAVTTVTEHNSVLRPLNHLKSRGVRVVIIGLDSTGGLDASAFDAALASGPALVVVNHGSNVTGRINDVGRWFEKARDGGAVTLLDASQTIGSVSVPAVDLHADMVAFTGHKALLGPPGTGGLYVRPGLDLSPLIVGGTGVRSDLPLHPDYMPARLEAGTPNVPALAGLAVALRWLESNGEAFRSCERRAAARLRHELARVPGARIVDSPADVPRTGVVSFRIDGWSVEECGHVLQESFGVTCRTGLHCAPLIHEALGTAPEGTVRFGVSGFTTDWQIEAAVAAVRKMAGCGS